MNMKRVEEVMSREVACAYPDTPLTEIAKMMVACDCGEIPIVDNENDKRIVGVITDRDIVCRTLGVGKNPIEMRASECMTTPVVMAYIDMTLDDCLHLMEDNKVRRLPIVDRSNRLCGILSQADLIKNIPEKVIGMIKNVSQSTDSPSAVQ